MEDSKLPEKPPYNNFWKHRGTSIIKISFGDWTRCNNYIYEILKPHRKGLFFFCWRTPMCQCVMVLPKLLFLFCDCYWICIQRKTPPWVFFISLFPVTGTDYVMYIPEKNKASRSICAVHDSYIIYFVIFSLWIVYIGTFPDTGAFARTQKNNNQ